MIDKVKADHGGRSPDVITRGHGVSITGGAMKAWKSKAQVGPRHRNCTSRAGRIAATSMITIAAACFAISADGHTLVAAVADKSLAVWNLQTGQETKRIKPMDRAG